MSRADRWLLPEGVAELLPQQARRIERLRRELLDLYASWGYELVIPPMMEFKESLLIGLGADMDLQTFKLTDQLSGRMMALRADITPQAARIDAHSLGQDGVTRLCYAGTVLHTRPKSLLASRTPIEVGAELYGHAGIDSDCEVIQLMLETLAIGGAKNIHLDLGHVGIFRSLSQAAALDAAQEQQLFDALQRKSANDIDQLVAEAISDQALAAMVRSLVRLNGGIEVLAEARKVLAQAGEAVLAAIDTLEKVADQISSRAPQVTLYFDLAELRGYHYHTGLVFSALVPGFGYALANGGRYDNIGAVFGRARPATGFSADLTALMKCAVTEEQPVAAIFALHDDDPRQWQLIQDLRSKGEVVVVAYDAAVLDPRCNRQLVRRDDVWHVEAL